MNTSGDFNSSIKDIKELIHGFNDMGNNLKALISNIVNASNSLGDTTINMAQVSQSSIIHAMDTMNKVNEITGYIQEQAANTDVVTKNVEQLLTLPSKQIYCLLMLPLRLQELEKPGKVFR